MSLGAAPHEMGQMMERTYTDAPDMLDDERMTSAELRVVREFLGLTGDWIAAHLGVNPRTARAWEQARYPIPDGVRLEIEDLERRTGEWVGRLIEQIADMPDPVVITYRTDAEYHTAHPDIEFPASWHRAVCARIAQEVPGLSIVYPDEAER